MLKIKLIHQEFIFGRLAVSIAPKCLNFILGTFLESIGRFWIKTISPLSGGNSEELFTCVEYLLVVYLDVYIWLSNGKGFNIFIYYISMFEHYSFWKRNTPNIAFKIFFGDFVWRDFHFGILNVFLSPFANTAPNCIQRITLVWQAAQIQTTIILNCFSVSFFTTTHPMIFIFGPDYRLFVF